MSEHVLIVGASLAGATCAESLRAAGFEGGITLVGEEPTAPYSRPPLSKQVLEGVWDAATLRDERGWADLDVRLLLGHRARALDLKRREVLFESGPLPFGRLVIATGSVPRRPLGGARILRTLEDALALRAALGDARRVAVVGGGVLACEIASAARGRGLEAAILARGRHLSLGTVGMRIADRVETLLAAGGIEVRRLSVAVRADGQGVVLADGTRVDADLVVAATGADPAVSWLRGSGLDVRNGIRCDEHGKAAPGVHAIGDVAAWRDAATGETHRTGHQQSAIEQADAVARTIAGRGPSEVGPPFFWTSILGTRILACGRFPDDATLEVIERAGDDRFVLAARRDGSARGVIGWNMPREFRRHRAAMSAEEGIAA